MPEASTKFFGPDPTRTDMEGFCDGCGSVLDPMDYLECPSCYRRNKDEKRRYRREVANRQLELALERTRELAKAPMQCHWLPDAAILFGSMLNEADSKVGDVDLCVVGNDTRRHGLETYADLVHWAKMTAPPSFPQSRLVTYPRERAFTFIRARNNILSLYLVSDFAEVGGGRPFPYKVLWTRDGIDADTLQHAIETARPVAFKHSIDERQDNVQRTIESQLGQLR